MIKWSLWTKRSDIVKLSREDIDDEFYTVLEIIRVLSGVIARKKDDPKADISKEFAKMGALSGFLKDPDLKRGFRTLGMNMENW